jgi:hypothetical protein
LAIAVTQSVADAVSATRPDRGDCNPVESALIDVILPSDNPTIGLYLSHICGSSTRTTSSEVIAKHTALTENGPTQFCKLENRDQTKRVRADVRNACAITQQQ